MLHMDVFLQRLRQEYDIEVLATPPTVPYKGSTVIVPTFPSLTLLQLY